MSCRHKVDFVAALVLLTERRLPSTFYSPKQRVTRHRKLWVSVGVRRNIKGLEHSRLSFQNKMKRKSYKGRNAGLGQGKYVLKRSKTNISKKTVQAMKRVAKSVMKSQDELKRFHYAHEIELGILGTSGTNAYTRSFNLFYHNGIGSQTISRGTNDDQFLGDKIRWKGVAIKYKVLNAHVDTGLVWSDQAVTIDIFVVKLPAIYTTTSVPVNLLYNETSSDVNTMFLQSGVRILKKKTVRLTPRKDGDRTVVTGKIWIRKDQNIEYKDYDTGWDLKDSQNYYLYFINRSPAGSRTLVGFAYQNYFVDS